MSSNLFKSLLGLSVLVLVTLPAFAVTENDQSSIDLTSTNNQAVSASFDSNIAAGLSTDLIYNQVGTLTSGTGPDIDFTLAGLSDGKSTNGQDQTQTFFGTSHFANAFGASVAQFGNSLNSDPAVTFSSLGNSPTGYTLTSIQSIFGYVNEASFADQHFTIQYTTVANNAFQTLTSIDYHPVDPPSSDVLQGSAATDVTLTDLNLSGVTGIRFQFSPYVNAAGNEQFGDLIREIEVNGVATTVPEPSTWAMLGLGAAGLCLVLRARRLSA